MAVDWSKAVIPSSFGTSILLAWRTQSGPTDRAPTICALVGLSTNVPSLRHSLRQSCRRKMLTSHCETCTLILED